MPSLAHELLVGFGGGVAFWLFSTSLRPRLRPERTISCTETANGERYRIKIWNPGFRSVLDLDVQLHVLVPKLTSTSKNLNTIKLEGGLVAPLFGGRVRFSQLRADMPTCSSRTPLGQVLHRWRCTLSYLVVGANNHIVTVRRADPSVEHAHLVWPEDFRRYMLSDPIDLRAILEGWPGAQLRVAISGADRVTLTKAVNVHFFDASHLKEGTFPRGRGVRRPLKWLRPKGGTPVDATTTQDVAADAAS